MFDCADPDGGNVAITLTPVASNFAQPLLVKSAPGDLDTLYVVNKNGAIDVVQNGAKVSEFLNLAGIIETGSEQGVLGLAFHPDYVNNGRFFVHYSLDVGDPQGVGDSVVGEFARSMNDPLVADPDQVELVLQHGSDEDNHNGGSIEFGFDGFLYIALGDGGAQNDPGCDAQNTGNLLGKIMRIDVNGAPSATGYPAAAGNPDGAKYFHIGFRNPYRMSFDVCTGDLFIGDVGQGSWEEVSWANNGAAAANYGWPWREGAHDHNNDCPGAQPTVVEPISEYDHGYGCSITGGVVHRSAAAPSLRGHYFYGDYCEGEIIALRVDDNGMVIGQPVFTGVGVGQFSLTSFGNDGHGNVYVTDIADGEVLRIDPM
jgi:glucose/arabinose dehydrogenase